MISAAAGRIEYGDFESELLRAKLADSELALFKAQCTQGADDPRQRSASSGKPEAILEGGC